GYNAITPPRSAARLSQAADLFFLPPVFVSLPPHVLPRLPSCPPCRPFGAGLRRGSGGRDGSAARGKAGGAVEQANPALDGEVLLRLPRRGEDGRGFVAG